MTADWKILMTCYNVGLIAYILWELIFLEDVSQHMAGEENTWRDFKNLFLSFLVWLLKFHRLNIKLIIFVTHLLSNWYPFVGLYLNNILTFFDKNVFFLNYFTLSKAIKLLRYKGVLIVKEYKKNIVKEHKQ